MVKRSLILNLAVSLDGYIEGRNGEIDWCLMDEDMDFDLFLDRIDAIIFGRTSYELFKKSEPAPDAPVLEKAIWNMMMRKKKYVLSRTKSFIDEDSIVIEDSDVDLLKSEDGKDIWLYGGTRAITSFVNLGLVDEYQISVHPIILGGGLPLFHDIKKRHQLYLADSKTFSSGVVQLCYKYLF